MKQEENKWSKKINYEVPEEYFDDLAQRIQKQTVSPSPAKKQWSGLWKPALVLSFSVMFITVIFFKQNNTTSPAEIAAVKIEALDPEIVEDYLENEIVEVEWHEVDVFEQANQLDDLDDIYFDELNNDDILNELEASDLYEYEI